MKKTILVLSLICSVMLVNAQDINKTASSNFKNLETVKKRNATLSAKPNEANLWFWEKPGNYWSLKKRSEFTYTPEGKVRTLIVKDSIGNLISKETLTYERDTLLKEHLVESWFNNTWINTYRIMLWYNTNGDPIKEISQSWQNNQWETFFGFATTKVYDSVLRLETTYDSLYDGNSFVLTQKLERYFNTNSLIDSEITYAAIMTSTLEPMYKQYFIYNSAGLMDSVIQYTWDVNIWKNDRSTTNIMYDSLNRVVNVMNNVWDGSAWKVYTNTITNYLPYNSFEIVDYIRPNITYIEYKRHLFLNDSLYNQIRIKYESWNGVNWVADLHETSTYKYLPGGIIEEKLVQIENEFGQMQNETKEVFVFNSTGTNFIKHANLNVYPNPSKDVLNISGLNADVHAKITIVDLHGKVMMSKNTIGQTSMDISTLKPGVYLLRVGATVKKIVVSR